MQSAFIIHVEDGNFFQTGKLLVLRGKFSFITLGLVGGLINVNFLRVLKHNECISTSYA